MHRRVDRVHESFARKHARSLTVVSDPLLTKYRRGAHNVPSAMRRVLELFLHHGVLLVYSSRASRAVTRIGRAVR